MHNYAGFRLSDWNRRLLDHYFGRKSPDDPPVTSILTTQEELARAVGAPESEATEVRAAFVGCIAATMDRSLFPRKFDQYAAWADGHGSIQGAWKSVPPDFVAHLVFACLAVTESPDDLSDENSYITRLDALCEFSRTEDDLRLMPGLWRYLSEWLGQADSNFYRALKLPPDNGWTRIGYTVRLPFPNRRDQQTLVDVLQSSEVLDGEPAVARVLFAVGNAKDRFRKRFQESFVDFRTKYHYDASSGNSLREHPFWAAVQNAARHGEGRRKDDSYTSVIQLLAEASEDQFMPFLVANEAPAAELGFLASKLSTKLGPFEWLLSSSDASGVQASVEHAVADIMERRKRIRRLDSAVQQGVLLFADFDGGAFELVSDASMHDVRHALVREVLTSEFARRFSGKRTTIIRDAAEGWTALLDVHVTPVGPGELDGTVLERAWSLQRGIPITRLKVSGGVRVEGGWLGSREALPKFSSHGEGDLWLEREGGTGLALAKTAEGLWSLPPEDLEGSVRLVQRHADQDVDHIRIEFVSVPSVEEFRTPSAPETWLCESFGHSSPLGDGGPVFTDEHPDFGELADQVILLGPDVGQFVVDPTRAAWQITRFGKRECLRRGALRGSDAIPRAQVTTDQLRRRWRKLLCQSIPESTDPKAGAVRAAVRRAVFDDELLHRMPEGEQSSFASILAIDPASVLARLVTVLVARLNARVGMGLRDWYELLRNVTGIEDGDKLRSITRAWQEAGLIDVGSSARWCAFMVYGRPPALATFRCGGGWGATLTGLVLPSTVREVRTLAKVRGIAYEERRGCSEWVPASLCFRSATQEVLLELAREVHLHCTTVSMRTIEESARKGRLRAAGAPPVNYIERRSVPLWPNTSYTPQDIELVRWHRRDGPDFWEVLGTGARYWAYDPNSARIWASVLKGLSPVSVVDDGVIAERAYIPLALARFLGTVSGLRSGPCAKYGGRHCYPVHAASSAWLTRTIHELLLPTETPTTIASIDD